MARYARPARGLTPRGRLYAVGRASPVALALSAGDALAFHHRTETARQVYARVAQVSSAGGPQEGGTGLSQAQALVRLGRLDEARDAAGARRLERSLASDEAGSRAAYRAYQRARLSAVLGDHEAAVRLLRQAHNLGWPLTIAVPMDPDLQPLRGFPPFEDLVRPRR